MNTHSAIATLFGIGRARYAPGTVASIVALPLAWGIAASGGRVSLLIAAILAGAIGGWACEHYVRETGSHDPSECVIDELAGQWLACAFAPRAILAYALAFVLFRALDIAKPWPISAVEQLKGGLGVMADDLVAGLIAGLVVAIFAQAGLVYSTFSSPLLRLAEVVIADAREKKLRIATAESCTGGLIGGLLTEIPGSSDVFERGFIVYSNRAKSDLLNIPGDLIADMGAVSEAVARAMAEGAVENSHAHMAVAVTGVAGPGGGTKLKPVGLVHIAAAREGRSILHEAHRFGDIGRTEVRLKSVEAALVLLQRLM